MQQWSELIWRPSVAGPVLVALVLVYIIYTKLTRKSVLPNDGPWVGLRKERFARSRAALRSLSHTPDMIAEGYQKFTKAGKPFFLPSMFGAGSIILPPSYMNEAIAVKGEDVLNTTDLHEAVVASDYTIRNAQVQRVHLQHEIIRKQLTRSLPQLTPAISEELALAFDKFWGIDTDDWKEICVHETCHQIVSRTTNRVFVGAPLCRNTDFLDAASAYAFGVFTAGPFISAWPSMLQPLVGPFIARSTRKALAKCHKLLEPVIIERVANWERKKREPDWKWEAPHDYLSWQLEEADRLDDPKERDPEVILVRVMICNMVAIHSSTQTITNTLFSLCSTEHSHNYISAMRDECERVLADDNGTWSKTSINKMTKVDSAIRETLRMHPTTHLSVPRLVKQMGGFTFSDGQHVPQGTRIAFPAVSVHHDPSNYLDPLTYNPFRFSNVRDQLEAQFGSSETSSPTSSRSVSPNGVTDIEKTVKILSHRNQSLTTTSNSFLGFGRGQHSCPGRFFASNEIKLMLAYLLTHYEIEPLKERPSTTSFAEYNIHPMKATLRVRRLKPKGPDGLAA